MAWVRGAKSIFNNSLALSKHPKSCPAHGYDAARAVHVPDGNGKLSVGGEIAVFNGKSDPLVPSDGCKCHGNVRSGQIGYDYG